MAKDPRFNFYTDNWIGGTEGFTLEQEGAYLSLIIMQSKIGRFTAEQAIDKLMQKTRGNTAVCTELWFFLIPKFETDGEMFWSARLEKEVNKSETHSKLQSERIKKRWDKSGIDSGNTAVYTTDIPVNGSGIGIEDKIKESFDEIYLEKEKLQWPDIDFDFEFRTFCNKVRGSPEDYVLHKNLRMALQSQLRNAKPKKSTQVKNKYKIQ